MSAPASGRPAVSVCVPVYNTERFLRRCLDSLVGQTLRSVEIVVVNDGSTDGSQAIVEEYAARDARIVHAVQANAGLGATRNAGLRLATGEYVAFLDSDDWAEPDLCERLYEEACRSGADVIVADYWVHYPEGSQRAPFAVRHPDHLADRGTYLRAILERTVSGFSWNKLYRRTLLAERGLLFPLRDELENVEDQYYSLRAVHHAAAISFVHRPLVHYHIHSESIVQRYQRTLFRDQLALLDANRALFASTAAHEWALPAVESSFLNGVVSCALNESKESNPASLRKRVAAFATMGRHPLFRAAYDGAETGGLSWKARLLLAMIRAGPPSLAYALAKVYRSAIRRRTF